MSKICSISICILNFPLRFLNGHLPSAESSIQPVLTGVAYLGFLFPYTYNDASFPVQLLSSTISSKQDESWVFHPFVFQFLSTDLPFFAP